MKFGDLKPGDVVGLMGTRSVILAIEKPHPLNRNFWLIIWWMFDEKRLSFDMLSPEYDLIEGSTVVSDGMVSYRRAMQEIPQ
jgi:hypothetical protein